MQKYVMALTQFSEFMEEHQPEVVDEWWNLCEEDALLGPVGKLTREEFRNNIPGALDGFRKILVCQKEEVLDLIKTEVSKHGHHRWKQGFNLRELIRDWGHLNRALVQNTESFFQSLVPLQPEAHKEALDRLALFMTEATSGSVRRYDELRREESIALERDLKATEEQFDTITQARSRILREAAHDLQGSLSALTLHSRLFREVPDIPPTIEEILDQMDNGLESVSTMLRSLLDLTRLESGQETVSLSNVDIVETFHGLASEVEGVAIQKGIELIAEGPSELKVSTDPEKVRRIAQNLIVNALQHTAEGKVSLLWSQEGEQWKMIVEDSGPGLQAAKGSEIAKELKEKDIDSCSENKSTTFAYTGEGIGLAIVKRLCDLLHAGIHLDSHPGEGSTFTVVFPLDDVEEFPAPDS